MKKAVMMKERIPGYFETRAEIEYLLFRLSVDCRVLQKMIKNASGVLKECNRDGSLTSAKHYTEIFKGEVARQQQKITRESNKARKLFVDFVEKQSSNNNV